MRLFRRADWNSFNLNESLAYIQNGLHQITNYAQVKPCDETTTQNWVNIGSYTGLLPDGAKPLL